ncbi:GATA zinc finger domain-containing protein 10 [Aedes aegypti]|uniref:Chitin-binding type-2 domain-containing protein n=1 Tax=Aedes aegypti TaxID=7159 RepID=A0A903VBJ0_AEDAE|nr:GATA zinc finger domain-containing protein 10 [Aedes aegypti]
MKALAVCLVIAVVGVSAVPEYYAEFQQMWQQWQEQQHQLELQQQHQHQYQQQQHHQQQNQPQYPQWQEQQWQQQQPQQKPPQQEYSSDGYKIIPGVVDSRCPRTDDIDSPIHLPVRGNCGKFMKCYGGRAYEQDCPAGLEFGINVNRCDYPALAKCSSNGW